MKLYTKTGDNGETGLFGGKRVPKTDARIESYGTIDELNATLGLLQAHVSHPNKMINAIQGQLLVIGSHLATPYNPAEGAPTALPRFEESWITDMENWIDTQEKRLPPLTSFILPGGSQAGATAHVARTVCRRAERSLVALIAHEEIDLHILQYINRLSDLLFVLARSINQEAGNQETPWNS